MLPPNCIEYFIGFHQTCISCVCTQRLIFFVLKKCEFFISVFLVLLIAYLCGDAVYTQMNTPKPRDDPNCKPRDVSIWTTILQSNCNFAVASEYKFSNSVWNIVCWLWYNFIQTKSLTVYPILLPNKYLHRIPWLFIAFFGYIYFDENICVDQIMWCAISMFKQQNGLQCRTTIQHLHSLNIGICGRNTVDEWTDADWVCLCANSFSDITTVFVCVLHHRSFNNFQAQDCASENTYRQFTYAYNWSI